MVLKAQNDLAEWFGFGTYGTMYTVSGNGTQVKCPKSKLIQISNIHCTYLQKLFNSNTKSYEKMYSEHPKTGCAEVWVSDIFYQTQTKSVYKPDLFSDTHCISIFNIIILQITNWKQNTHPDLLHSGSLEPEIKTVICQTSNLLMISIVAHADYRDL